MKKLLFAAAAMMVAVAVHGQGQVNFSNRQTGGPDAPITAADGSTRLAGATFLAQLYGGPQGTAAGSLTAQGATAPFQSATLAGYFFGNARSITGVAGGSVATLQVRVWDSATGATWETASVRSALPSKSSRQMQILSLTLS